jgi:mannose-6-phosphate isomerase
MSWVEHQDTTSLLAAVNVLSVKPGDTVFVPAGIPHAVGEGILIVELQEPTDLSVLMEWANLDIDGRRDGHLGLGFDRVLDSVDRSGWSKERLTSLINQGSNESLLPRTADGFFRARRVDSSFDLEPAFSILIVLDGQGSFHAAEGPPLSLARGDTILVPHGAGQSRLEGPVTAIRCLPPDAASG